MRRSRLSARMILAVAAPVAVSFLTALVVFVMLRSPLDAIGSTREIGATVRDADELVKAILDSETGERGYLLSGREEFLEPYHDGVASFTRLVPRLRAALATSPGQLERIARLEAVFHQWHDTWAEPLLAMRRDSSQPDAIGAITARIASGRGKAMVDEMRDIATRLIESEQQRETRVLAESEAATQRARTLAVVGPALAFVAAIGIALLLSRRAARDLLSVVRTAEALAAGDSNVRADIQGDAETSAVAGALNAMADRLAARSNEAGSLREMGEYLQSCDSVREAGDVVSRMATRLFPSARGAIFLLDASRRTAAPVTAWGDGVDATTTGTFAPTECWAIRRASPHRADGPSAIRCDHDTARAPHSLCIPLMAHGEVMGIHHLESDEPIDERLAGLAADQVGMSVANLRLRESLREQSIRDVLTGLYNRRYFDEVLEREIRRASRSGQPLSLLFFDVDHFKQFNDTFGHEAGDAVLRAMGALVRRSIRGADIGCRYGGEEFVAVLPETATDDAVRCAERLREGAAALELKHAGIALRSVTISIGVAALVSADDVTSFVRRADAALYAAKQAGRNRVLVAPTP